MYVENKDNSIVIHLEGEHIEREAEIIELLAYSIDVTFGELLNEGSPVSLGNAYAEYVFTAYQDGFVWTYGFGNYELEKLNELGEVTLEPYPYNDLEEVGDTFAA